MSLLVIVLFLVLAFLGMPLAFSLGVSAMAGLWLSGFDLSVLAPRLMNSVNSFPLMSIPLFMVAGELMLKGGIMDRLVDFANAFIGRIRGGLAQVAIIAGAGLASVSGAAVADASALSSTLVPSLKKQYGLGFSTGIVAAAANLGPIIPPSGAMIVYAFMAGSSVSVGGLFMAGVIPGLILFLSLMALCWLISWWRDYPLAGEPISLANILRQLRRSILVFLMPVVVIGGIVAGAFTPTEGAAVGGLLRAPSRFLRDAPASPVRSAGRSADRGEDLGAGGRHDRLRLDRHVPLHDRSSARCGSPRRCRASPRARSSFSASSR